VDRSGIVFEATGPRFEGNTSIVGRPKGRAITEYRNFDLLGAGSSKSTLVGRTLKTGVSAFRVQLQKVSDLGWGGAPGPNETSNRNGGGRRRKKVK